MSNQLPDEQYIMYKEAFADEEYYDKKKQDSFPRDNPREAFRAFDRDGDGMISKDDLRHGTRLLGERLSEKALDKMMNQYAGPDPDGKIDYYWWALMYVVRKHIAVPQFGQPPPSRAAPPRKKKPRSTGSRPVRCKLVRFGLI